MKITKRTKELTHDDFFFLFNQFILDTGRGHRMKPNGRLIRDSTINNYSVVKKVLCDFVEETDFRMKIYIACNLSKNETIEAKRYSQQFYMSLTNYFYRKGFFDNYVGHVFKIIRAFYNYLLIERQMDVGSFHKKFYVFKEEIPIVVISPEQLNYLIYNKEFHASLDTKMRVVKDLFVFGCTVALRVGDLLNLQPYNLMVTENNHYLKVYSQKTNTPSFIKLPDYAIEIIKKYSKRQKTLLPTFSISHFNKRLKKLAKYITNDEPMIKTRTRRGEQVVIYKNEKTKLHYNMADHITTHTMRRTAITTMLRLGMHEQAVRKISGHSPTSKEFYKYVAYTQDYMDRQIDKVFERLQKIA